MSALLIVLAQAQFLDSGGDSPPSQGFNISPTGFLAILVIGFIVGVVGHVVKSRALVVFGISLIFGATVLVPVVLAITH